MNIAFFGTSDKSTPILDSLRNLRDHSLALCITKPDALVGRKRQPKETGVKKWAKENNVNFIEVDNLKGDQLDIVIHSVEGLNIQLAVVADFSLFIPEKLISTFKYGMINVHFSLLPKLRGASPVQYAILNGDKKTGITFFLIEKSMDTGPILYQTEHELNGSETSGELNSTLFHIAAQNIEGVINRYLEGKTLPQSQNHEEASYCYSPSHPTSTFIYKEDAKINWKENPELIERKIRAFNPWPVAWTTLGELAKSNTKDLEGYKLRPDKNPDLIVKIYTAVYIVGSHDNALTPDVVQVEGSNKISCRDLVNGYFVKTT